MRLPTLEQRHVVFLVCVVGIFITVFDTSSSIVALPTIAHEFGTEVAADCGYISMNAWPHV